eukprot:TRINITY_DN13431_c0_g1_i1.p1 TRINITY_DN13431_c0_g1~~TRINITY_DN13431_c0_g1_i1.p1  ORF type:complete len:315 (+),score=76.98 TRINITY_DN13431_c0_g1_i1:35-979(+)
MVGVIKTLTTRFVQLRMQYKPKSGPRSIGSGPGGEVDSLLQHEPDIEMGEKKTPHWVQVVEVQHKALAVLAQKIDELHLRHSKHLLPGFDDRRDEEQHIEVLTKSITSVFVKCQRQIKEVTAHNVNEKLSHNEEVARRNVQASLAMQLQDLSLKFRKEQKDYLTELDSMEQRGQRKMAEMGLVKTQPAFPFDTGGADMPAPRPNRNFTQVQIDAMIDREEMVQDREREIRALEKSVGELAEMFKDLAQLVVDQGSLLDSIEYNLEQAQENTAEAVEEIEKAHQSAASMRCKLCIIVLILLVVVFGIILVVKIIK